MKPELAVILFIFLIFIGLEIIFTRFFNKDGQKPGDAIVEIASTLALTLITQPLVIFLGFSVAAFLAPGSADSLTSWPIWGVIGLFLIFDDMTQYWWHRASHSFTWLYNLHRAHHNAKYMSIRLVYRNNIFYYMMMPGIWFSAILIYLGLGWVYAGYIVVKLAVISGAHSDVAWDKPLYKIKWLSPIMWVVERTISTPATHHAHHGRHLSDGKTNYKGNFGNLLFFWDVLFGTAKITREYPDSYGVENLAPATLGQQLAWPLFPENSKGGMTAKQEAEARH